MENKEQQPLEEAEETAAGEKQEEEIQPHLITRRDFLLGAGAGAAAGIVATAGVVSVTRPAAPAARAPGGVAPAAEMAPIESKVITLKVNGESHSLHTLEVQPQRTLLEVLRQELGLTGSKKGCNRGQCGACTALVDGKPIYACSMLAIEAEGKDIWTIEGLAEGNRLHPVQAAFIEHMGFQCAFCTPGMIMASKSLLDVNPNPTREDVREALAGNLCRCGNYQKIFESVEAAAKMMAKGIDHVVYDVPGAAQERAFVPAFKRFVPELV